MLTFLKSDTFGFILGCLLGSSIVAAVSGSYILAYCIAMGVILTAMVAIYVIDTLSEKEKSLQKGVI